MFPRLREMSARQGDLALAAAMAVTLLVELSVENVGGPAVVNYAFGLVMTGALYWRRRLPVAVIAVQCGSGILQGVLGGDLINSPFSPFFSVLIGFYSVGAYASYVWALRGLVIGIPGVIGVSVASHQTAVGDFLFPVVLVVGAPWAAGRVQRVWAQRARELARANQR